MLDDVRFPLVALAEAAGLYLMLKEVLLKVNDD
jgi:hypothetical protein